MFTSVGPAMTIEPLNGFVPGEDAREVSLPMTSVHFEPATTLFEWARFTSAFVTVRVQVPSIGAGGGAAVAAATKTSARATTERTISFMHAEATTQPAAKPSSRRDEQAAWSREPRPCEWRALSRAPGTSQRKLANSSRGS